MVDGLSGESGSGHLEGHFGSLSVEADHSTRLSELLQQCRLLLGELEEFQTYIVEKRINTAVEIRSFTGNVKSELKLLEKVGTISCIRISKVPYEELTVCRLQEKILQHNAQCIR